MVEKNDRNVQAEQSRKEDTKKQWEKPAVRPAAIHKETALGGITFAESTASS